MQTYCERKKINVIAPLSNPVEIKLESQQSTRSEAQDDIPENIYPNQTMKSI